MLGFHHVSKGGFWGVLECFCHSSVKLVSVWNEGPKAALDNLNIHQYAATATGKYFAEEIDKVG